MPKSGAADATLTGETASTVPAPPPLTSNEPVSTVSSGRASAWTVTWKTARSRGWSTSLALVHVTVLAGSEPVKHLHADLSGTGTLTAVICRPVGIVAVKTISDPFVLASPTLAASTRKFDVPPG